VKSQSRMTGKEPHSGHGLDGGESVGKKPALSADAVACAACANAFDFVQTTARSCVPRMPLAAKAEKRKHRILFKIFHPERLSEVEPELY
jgi:hypothetical protein